MIIFGISIITFYTTPLMIVSAEGYTEIVKLLLSKPNIEINCKDILTINTHEIPNLFFLSYSNL